MHRARIVMIRRPSKHIASPMPPSAIQASRYNQNEVDCQRKHHFPLPNNEMLRSGVEKLKIEDAWQLTSAYGLSIDRYRGDVCMDYRTRTHPPGDQDLGLGGMDYPGQGCPYVWTQFNDVRI
jgi:hypothetical protein